MKSMPRGYATRLAYVLCGSVYPAVFGLFRLPASRLTAFLELDDAHVGARLAKDAVLGEVAHDPFQFEAEDPRHQVGPVLRLLAGQQGGRDFGPLRVTCYSNEEGRLPEGAHDGHGVHVPARQKDQ